MMPNGLRREVISFASRRAHIASRVPCRALIRPPHCSAISSHVYSAGFELPLQWRELLFVMPPLGYRRIVNRPAYLHGARRGARRGIGVKLDATVLPIEPAERQQLGRL